MESDHVSDGCPIARAERHGGEDRPAHPGPAVEPSGVTGAARVVTRNRGQPGSPDIPLQHQASEPSRVLERAGYELEVEDTFKGHALDTSLWLASYLPQWSSQTAAAARYSVEDGSLRLRIDAGQGPWCREHDGELRVSSLQTGVFAGPLGSTLGQHRFREGLVVRETQRNAALYADVWPLRGAGEGRGRPQRHGVAVDDRL